MSKYRVLLGVVIEVKAENKTEAAEKAGKIAAGLGFSFESPTGFDETTSCETKLLDVAKIDK